MLSTELLLKLELQYERLDQKFLDNVKVLYPFNNLIIGGQEFNFHILYADELLKKVTSPGGIALDETVFWLDSEDENLTFTYSQFCSGYIKDSAFNIELDDCRFVIKGGNRGGPKNYFENLSIRDGIQKIALNANSNMDLTDAAAAVKPKQSSPQIQ
ncbi:MAG: hypothetical protein M1300_10785 [Epsilonproteobacteria bacterium]|nr:hypothetical protein [Campylobacterota bacterium]